MKYVDDIIREEKRKYSGKGIQPNLFFWWGAEGFEQLRRFLAAVIICPHGLNCITCDYGDRVVDKYMIKGFTFLGARHSWDKRRSGMLLSVGTVKKI